ncbi:uncharacterized protein TRIADDRAFT_60085 [Trichoplax adhaerens]|uniref:Ig-like domain-containing protein n=1 Tax=Trichoplax adhaerens TaxID=10228 RepID=B3S794_TRIAD|nr:hypothetical protein TRIADDRAFT_60085 [Trichoplax adhaerens]EDV21445.1 hypothetical protein TRIADDRAFT_60085 [Trichoplax adhaerens]|eukprot:XP_002116045.1 hypothetical protein TRIADDRAFT_60085 [Trichoplax adhaerens]
MYGDGHTKLRLAEYPRIIQHPKSVNIIYGKTLTLQCNGTSSPIANVTWLKDGNPLTSYDDMKLILNFYVYSRLTISNITTQDEGLYQCRYDNIIGSITSEVATVTIYDSETAQSIGREFHFGYLDTIRSAAIPFAVITALSKSTDTKTIRSIGREFYFGLFSSGSAGATVAAIVTALDKSAAITVRNNYFNTATQYNVSSYSSTTVKLKATSENRVTGIASKTIHITSDEDITVTSLQASSTLASSCHILPVQFYGKEYVIATYTPLIYGHMLIISKDANTQVEISFPSNTNYGGQTYSRNRNLTINLLPNQGFFFQIAQDLTGTIIYSNKDISVLAGNLCANVPTSNRYCEPLQEHYIPSKYLGQNYILSTFTGRAAGDIYRIVAAYDNTTVRLQSASSNYNLSRGEFTQFELASGTDSFLTCDKPCLVVQFAKGTNADLKGADPFMTIVPAIEQYSNNLVITVPSLFTIYNINPNYVLITIQDKYKDGLMLNGKVLQGISWRQVTTNDVSNVYSTASINISIGTSRLTHNDSSMTYGAIQYGWASGSIGYGSFGDIQWSTMFSCKSIEFTVYDNRIH